MKTTLGIVIAMLSVFLGLYIGGWLCFIGGIVQIINEIKSPHVDALPIALGIARVVVANLVIWTISIVGFVIGLTIFSAEDK